MAMPKNRVLSRFPATIREQLAANLRRVDLEAGAVIHRAGDEVESVYFPLNSVICVTAGLPTGEWVQVGLVGNREMVGLDGFMGAHELNQTAYVVRVAGRAVVAPADLLIAEFDSNKDLRDVLLRYTQSYIAQLSQNVVCALRHTITKRLARFLIELRSRTNGDVIRITHENVAAMLGVRRSGITEELARMEQAKLIRCDSKVITIIDMEGLKESACECYGILQKEYARLLGKREAEYDGGYPSN